MKERILVVGYDQSLLLTRAWILNTRWSAQIADPGEALNMLERERFDLIVLCHSLAADEALSLASAVRTSFPKVSILALETSPATMAHTDFWANASTHNGPSEMLNAIEALLEPGTCSPSKLPDLC